MSEKKERVWEVLQEIMNLIPAPQKMMLSLLIPQFQHSFEELPEEELDRIIDIVKGKIAYIEDGTNAEPVND